ncbi:tetratricopeptide repeat protein [Aliarcobacter butzleri]|uniref:tetratricopeptide repeat protein n=1 Tax=Aliarcobacter butzleri TaxID=28197 RepID=UPI001EDB3DDE|nr:tetratricopeptide repeat protein [Aliarcobacter butzleri]MCG3666292.1 tetratricopeptide repeat protein [Aliarcobacter butzleri]
MRSLGLDEFVDEIYEDVQKNSDSKYVFFLGAGCSVSSGINLAKDLAKDWYEELKKQKTKFNKFNENKDENNIDFGDLYFKIFETLFPTPLAQQKEIQRITENVTPSLGYYVLSEFMQKPQFNTIITTNFDNLIQDALIYSGNKRALVITHQDLAKFIERNDTPLITKIHGDAHIHPFNNSNDTKEIPEDLKIAIQGLFINAKLIFIGYKGNDESIANLLEGCKRIDQVYWFGSNKPTNTKLKKWWEEQKSKTHIKERDFDKIMSLIRDKFKLEKPDFKKRFEELEKCYNKAEQDETKNIENIENKTYIDYFILGNNYFHQKEYEKAIEAYKEAYKINPKDSDTLNNWGNALYDLAIAKNNDEDLYNQALIKYETASKLNPKDEDIFNNWGNALYDLAKAKDDNEDLFNQAFSKYATASKLNPKDEDIFNNWGFALSDLAKVKDNNEDLYNQAFRKYETASKLDPKKDFIFNNWGVALYNLAKAKNNDENLYIEAFEKLSKAVELGSSVYNLACFYSIRKNKKEALELLEKALGNKEIKANYVENEDEDWDNFKEDEDFKKLIKKYS